LLSLIALLGKVKIECCWVDEGDDYAGRIRVLKRAVNEKESTSYRMHINQNHSAPVQFATLAHELGHLFLGHLGSDKKLGAPKRQPMDHRLKELEAESVSYIVCARNGVRSHSERYLRNYVRQHTTIDDIDLYRIMRAAGQIETVLGLASKQIM
jgi:antirestriction protein ArdC